MRDSVHLTQSLLLSSLLVQWLFALGRFVAFVPANLATTSEAHTIDGKQFLCNSCWPVRSFENLPHGDGSETLERLAQCLDVKFPQIESFALLEIVVRAVVSSFW